MVLILKSETQNVGLWRHKSLRYLFLSLKSFYPLPKAFRGSYANWKKNKFKYCFHSSYFIMPKFTKWLHVTFSLKILFIDISRQWGMGYTNSFYNQSLNKSESTFSFTQKIEKKSYKDINKNVSQHFSGVKINNLKLTSGGTYSWAACAANVSIFVTSEIRKYLYA